MPEFIFSYRAPKGYTPTGEGWDKWFAGMGESLLDLGKPVVDRQGVGTCSSDQTQLNGFSIVDADNLEAALAIATKCPFVAIGGGVEVGVLQDPSEFVQRAAGS